MRNVRSLRDLRAPAAMALAVVAVVCSPLAVATPFVFNTGDPNGLMATASRPATAGRVEIESADDFLISSQTSLTSATFTGLLTGGVTVSSIGEVRVEIYRVFPTDSDVNRTSGPPTFSTTEVPTRVNSPSDVEFVDRDTVSSNLSFSTSVLSNSFTVLNSVQSGINPKPNQTTGGDGAVTGQEVRFSVTFLTPIDLAPDHYFFVPQVQITSPDGQFLWLSGQRPLGGSGTTPFLPDLQSWIRNDALAPDWLRIGTDIVGPLPNGGAAPTINASFSLNGQIADVVPEPGTLLLLASGMMIGVWRRRAVWGTRH
jgi:hypothetical protein